MPDEPPSDDPRPSAPPDPAPFSWASLGRDLARPRVSQLVFAAILALVAFAITVQVQSQARDDTYASLRRADLVALLDDLTAESRRLEGEIATLESTRQ